MSGETNISEEERRQQDELREMVLSATMALALRAVDAGEQTGATVTTFVEAVSVGAVTWHLKVTYYGNQGCVQGGGHPQVEEGARIVGPFMLFGDASQQGAFCFDTPVAWLRAASAMPGGE